MESTAFSPDDFPPPPDYVFPTFALCDQQDDACNARYRGAYQDFDLTLRIAPGANAAQIGLIGNYLYTSPLPEPVPLAMLLLGLVPLALRWRNRRV